MFVLGGLSHSKATVITRFQSAPFFRIPARLPSDILLEICCFLKRRRLYRVQLTSRKHRAAVVHMGRATPWRFISDANIKGYEVEITASGGKVLKSDVSSEVMKVRFILYALQYSRLRNMRKLSTILVDKHFAKRRYIPTCQCSTQYFL